MEDHPQGPQKPGSGRPQGHDPLTLPAQQQADDPWEDWDEDLQAALILSAEAGAASAQPQAAQVQPQGQSPAKARVHPQASAAQTYRPRPPRHWPPPLPWRERCASDHVEPGDQLIQRLPHGGHILPNGAGPVLDDQQGSAYFAWLQHLPHENGLYVALGELAELMRARNLTWIAIDDAIHDVTERQEDVDEAKAAQVAAKPSGASEQITARLDLDVSEAQRHLAAAQQALDALMDAWQPLQSIVERAESLVIRMINGDMAVGSIFRDANPAQGLQIDPGLANWRQRIEVRAANYAYVVAKHIEHRQSELEKSFRRRRLLATRFALMALVPLEIMVLSKELPQGKLPDYEHFNGLFQLAMVLCFLGLMCDLMIVVDRYRGGPDTSHSG